MAKISEDTMSLSSSDTETETLCNSDSDHDPISDTKLSFSDVARMMTEMYTSVYKDFGTIPKKFGATFIRKYAKDDTVKNIDRLCMEMRTKCRDMFWESQSTSRRALVLLDDFTKVFLPFLMKPTSTVPVKDKLRHLEKYLKIIETDHEGAEKCRSGFTTLLEELREWIWSLEVGLQNNDELVGQEVKMLENDIEIGKQAIQDTSYMMYGKAAGGILAVAALLYSGKMGARSGMTPPTTANLISGSMASSYSSSVTCRKPRISGSSSKFDVSNNLAPLAVSMCVSGGESFLQRAKEKRILRKSEDEIVLLKSDRENVKSLMADELTTCKERISRIEGILLKFIDVWETVFDDLSSLKKKLEIASSSEEAEHFDTRILNLAQLLKTYLELCEGLRVFSKCRLIT